MHLTTNLLEAGCSLRRRETKHKIYWIVLLKDQQLPHLRLRCVASSCTSGEEAAERVRERVSERARLSTPMVSGASSGSVPRVWMICCGSAEATVYLRHIHNKAVSTACQRLNSQRPLWQTGRSHGIHACWEEIILHSGLQ